MNIPNTAPPRPVLFLIDGNSQMYRAYHAIRGLTGPDGRSTNAVYGFVTMLRKLLAEQRPELIACTFDLAGPTFRAALAADYKANRPAMPDDLAEQIPWVHQACEAMGVPLLACEGYEADDVIGTVTERALAEGYHVIIVTGDKDLFQLVRDGVRVFNPRDEGTWYDAEGVREKFGVPPDRVSTSWPSWATRSTTSRACRAIGEKGARELITTYGSLDALLERAGEVTQKKYREALLANAGPGPAEPRAGPPADRRARHLRDRALPLPRARIGRACFALFAELGFRSLLNEFAPTAATVSKDYALVDSATPWRALAAELRRAGRFALRDARDAGTNGPRRDSSASRFRPARGTRATCRCATARWTAGRRPSRAPRWRS